MKTNDTTSAPLDLDAIEARACAFAECRACTLAWDSADDVPTLADEVHRLRSALAAARREGAEVLRRQRAEDEARWWRESGGES